MILRSSHLDREWHKHDPKTSFWQSLYMAKIHSSAHLPLCATNLVTCNGECDEQVMRVCWACPAGACNGKATLEASAYYKCRLVVRIAFSRKT